MGSEPYPISTEHNRGVEKEILKAIEGIRFGSVEIIIQDSRVIQIERKEKVRFDRVAANNGRN